MLADGINQFWRALRHALLVLFAFFSEVSHANEHMTANRGKVPNVCLLRSTAQVNPCHVSHVNSSYAPNTAALSEDLALGNTCPWH